MIINFEINLLESSETSQKFTLMVSKTKSSQKCEDFFVVGTKLRSFQFRKDLAIVADISIIEGL